MLERMAAYGQRPTSARTTAIGALADRLLCGELQTPDIKQAFHQRRWEGRWMAPSLTSCLIGSTRVNGPSGL